MKKVLGFLCILTLGWNYAQEGPDPTRARPASTPETESLALCFAPGTSDKYVEEITTLTGIGNESFGSNDKGGVSEFILTSRWTATATNGGGLVQGDPTVLTWSYIPDGTIINNAGIPGEPTGPSNLFAWLNGLYGNFNTWHALFVQVFDRWSELTGITYVYEPKDDGAAMPNPPGFPGTPGVLGVRGDIRIGAHFIDGPSNILAYNYFPSFGGEMILDSADTFFNDLSNNSLKLRNTVAHEAGHGFGLRHVCPVNQTKLMEPFASTAFDGPQFDDILGAQRHYGDFFEHNDTSATATSLGVINPNGSITVDTVSIDDNSDQNYYSFTVGSGLMTSITVGPPMVPAYFSDPQNPNGSCPPPTNLFDPNNIHDLGFEVLDTDGVTVLALVNNTGVGMDETIVNLPLSGSGTYFIRVFGDTTNNIQAYNMTVEVNRCRAGFSFGDWNLPPGMLGTGWVAGYLFERGNFAYKFAGTLVETASGQGTVTGTIYDGVAPNPDYDVVGTYRVTNRDCGTGTFSADIFIAGTSTLVGSISGTFCDDPATDIRGMYRADWEICD